MSSNNLNKEEKKPEINSNLKASIVHKPFATGTINIFNPHRSKPNGELSNPKLFLNAELEKDPKKPETEFLSDLELETSEVEYRDKNWLDSLLSPWGISAISIIFFVNLVSGAFIWRNSFRVSKLNDLESPVSSVGNANLAAQEFMPLNLSTLSMIKPGTDASVEDSKPLATPISPALAPLNSVTASSSINPQYHYVLTEYAGDQSLSLARQKVKQVSLVNFPQGVFIYLGAFTDKEQADEFVSQLKQENFPAYIYPFD